MQKKLKQAAQELSGRERPDIFSYADPTEYLRDLLTYLKALGYPATIRELAQASGLSGSYLSMALTGKRRLKSDIIERLTPSLRLSDREQRALVRLSAAAAHGDTELRVAAYRKLQRFHGFRKTQQEEFLVNSYLGHWWNVALRELSLLSPLPDNPALLQEKLLFKVKRQSIRRALKFLQDSELLKKNKEGRLEAIGDATLSCQEQVYGTALKEFHRQALNLAKDALQNQSASERFVSGQTLAVDENNLEAIKEIMNEALDRIQKLERKSPSGSRVYHIEVCAFPLSAKKGEE